MFDFSASCSFEIKILQWKLGKGNYTHVETDYIECAQLFPVRKFRNGTSWCWIRAGEDKNEVNVSVKEANWVWVEKQNPWKDHREISRAQDGKSRNNSSSQEQEMETDEGEDTKRGTKNVFLIARVREIKC